MAHALKKKGKGLVGLCLGYDSKNMTGRKGWAVIKGEKYKTCDDCDLGGTDTSSWGEIKNFCGLAIGAEVAPAWALKAWRASLIRSLKGSFSPALCSGSI